ncbi:uncharacterized protein LOC131881699 [Tigriopus californicus]|uniref:uncharacterized protein LOC131881699 n=1 Tax=Tigriopus californicus TaxID=6832 RepID=UPI0027DAAFE8|nr:uncharacterized protein LOC131881699 [Tigriopus californicus]
MLSKARRAHPSMIRALLFCLLIFGAKTDGVGMFKLFQNGPGSFLVGSKGVQCLDPPDLAMKCQSYNWERVQCNVSSRSFDLNCDTDCQIIFHNRKLDFSSKNRDHGEFSFESGPNFAYPKCMQNVKVQVRNLSGNCLKGLTFKNFQEVTIANGAVDLNVISPDSVQLTVHRHEELYCFARRTSLPLLTEVRYVPLDPKPSNAPQVPESHSGEIQTVRKEGYDIEETFLLEGLIPNTEYKIWTRQRPVQSDTWTVAQEFRTKTQAKAPDVPITSNFTYEMFPLVNGNHRVLLYWAPVPTRFQFGGKFDFVVFGMCASGPDQRNILNPDPNALIPGPWVDGTRKSWNKANGTHLMWQTTVKTAFLKFEVPVGKRHSCRISIVARNVAGSSHPSQAIFINIPAEIQAARPPRSAVMKWSNGTRRIFWEMPESWNAPPYSHVPTREVHLAWCPNKSVLCDNGAHFKSVSARRHHSGGEHELDQFITYEEQADIWSSTFESQEHVISHVGLSVPGSAELSQGLSWIPCPEIEESQPLNGQISISRSKGTSGTDSSSSSIASAEEKLEISFVSCPKCPTHLGLLVKAWRVWICPFEALTEKGNCSGKAPAFHIGPPPPFLRVRHVLLPGQAYEVSLEMQTHFGTYETVKLPSRLLPAPTKPPSVVEAVMANSSSLVVHLEQFHESHICQFALDSEEHILEPNRPCRSQMELDLDHQSSTWLNAQQGVLLARCPSLRLRSCNPSGCSNWSKRLNNIIKAPNPVQEFHIQEYAPNQASMTWKWDPRTKSDGLDVEIQNSQDGEGYIEYFTQDFGGLSPLDSTSCAISARKMRSLTIHLPHNYCIGGMEVKFQLRIRGFRKTEDAQGSAQRINGPWSGLKTTSHSCQLLTGNVFHHFWPFGLCGVFGSLFVTLSVYFIINRVHKSRRQFQRIITQTPENYANEYEGNFFDKSQQQQPMFSF